MDALLAQVAMPTADQEPWPWLAAMIATALAVVFWRLLDAQGKRIEDWKATCEGKDALIAAERASNEALRRELTATAQAALEAAKLQVQEQARMIAVHNEERRVLLAHVGLSAPGDRP